MRDTGYANPIHFPGPSSLLKLIYLFEDGLMKRVFHQLFEKQKPKSLLVQII
jgi:hypothetical protein